MSGFEEVAPHDSWTQRRETSKENAFERASTAHQALRRPFPLPSRRESTSGYHVLTNAPDVLQNLLCGEYCPYTLKVLAEAAGDSVTTIFLFVSRRWQL